jgi:hypothetical protein
MAGDDFGKRVYIVAREGQGTRFLAHRADLANPPHHAGQTQEVSAFSETEAIAIAAAGYEQMHPPAVLVDAIEDAISQAQAGHLDHGVQARAVLEAIDRIGR